MSDDESDEAEPRRFERFLSRIKRHTPDGHDADEAEPSSEHAGEHDESTPQSGETESSKAGRWRDLADDSEPSERARAADSDDVDASDSQPSETRHEEQSETGSVATGSRRWSAWTEGGDTGSDESQSETDATETESGGFDSLASERDTATSDGTDDERAAHALSEGSRSPQPGRSRSWEQLGSTDVGAGSADEWGTDVATDTTSSTPERKQSVRSQTTIDSEELAQIDPTAQVLVLGSASNRVHDQACSAFLASGPEHRNALIVTTGNSVTERLRVCHEASGGSFSEFAVIAVGGGQRATEESEITESVTGSSVKLHRVSSPTNLSRLGIVISQTISKWDGDDVQPVVCFHTLTHFLNYVDTEQLFRFLQTLRGRFRESGVGAHYHLDPSTVDAEVLGILSPIFDDVVHLDENTSAGINR
jgi:hypothetical protein